MIATRIWLLALVLNCLAMPVILCCETQNWSFFFSGAALVFIYSFSSTLPGRALLWLCGLLLKGHSLRRRQTLLVWLGLSLLAAWTALALCDNYGVGPAGLTGKQLLDILPAVPFICTAASVLLQYRFITWYQRVQYAQTNQS